MWCRSSTPGPAACRRRSSRPGWSRRRGASWRRSGRTPGRADHRLSARGGAEDRALCGGDRRAGRLAATPAWAWSIWRRSRGARNVVVQGNLDPLVLVAGGAGARAAVDAILQGAGRRPHIFNLGHGIVPETPPETRWRMLVRVGARSREAYGALMLLWLKALHIIAVISWMAGLLYLPRLFVYHGEAEPGSKQSETFKVMEQRLLRLIMNPAMIVVWVTGPWLAWAQGMLARPLAAGQVRPGRGADRLPPRAGRLAQGLRGGPQQRATSGSIASPTRCRRC